MFHKRLVKEFKENKKYIIGIVGFQWLSLIANVIFLHATAGMISLMYKKEVTTRWTILYLITLLFVLIARSLFNHVATTLSYQVSSQVKISLRDKIYRKLLRLGGGYREHIATSEAVQISTEGVEQLEIYFGKYIPQFFYSLLAPITLFVIVGGMSFKVAILLLLCVPMIPVSIIAVQKIAKKMLNKYWGAYTELGDSFLENLQGLTTLKIFQAEKRYAKKMDEEAEKFRKVTMRVLIMQLNSISVMDLIAYGGAALGIMVALYEFQKGVISLTECFFIIMVSAEFFLPLRLLGSFFHIAMNGNAAANKIFALLDSKEPNKGSVTKVSLDSIKLENVTFGYEEDRTVLNQVSMEIKKGQFTALVGTSGCGKSTIASLLMGERKGYHGEILFGKTDLREIEEDTLYHTITRITHESYLFQGSVRDNLLFGNEKATDYELEEALRKVDLYDFISQNGGLSMELKEKASNLSGGQRQRLSLARAILHESDVYLFDEATSNIDAESENKIMQVIMELSKVKTVILISHRLANVVAADQIFVLKDGKITEAGDHDSLTRQMGYYYNLYESQKTLESYTWEEAYE